MHVILNQGHLMVPCNRVTSIITCFPNSNPWPHGIDFHAALLPLHRAEANTRWIGLKINALSTVWLIHSLSGVITVPSTTMSRGETRRGCVKPMLRDEWTDSSKWEEYAKICAAERAQSHVRQSTKRIPEPIQELINRHLWRGLALTLSNYHTALWWSIWVKSFGQASWHGAPPVQSAAKEKPERAQALRCDLGRGLTGLRAAAEINGTFGRRAPADVGDRCCQGARLQLLSCQAGWAEGGCLLLFPVPRKQRGITNENKARCLRLKWVERHVASCCPAGTWWSLRHRMWRSPLLMPDVVESRRWFVICHP